MARAEDLLRRLNMTSSASLSTVYMDQLIDVCDIGLSPSNVLYDFALTSSSQDDNLHPSLLVPLPPPTLKSSRKKRGRKVSSIDRLFFCNECGATFSNSSNLKSHLRTHTGEKPYTCDICGISFVQSSNLKGHKRTHTGERPFKCTECGRAFSRSSHLVGHMRTHTGEMPYSCGVCSKAFASSTLLRKHTQIHGDNDSHVCSVCYKSFPNSSSLAIHSRIHSGERPFVCVKCTAAFRSREDLQIHKKLHYDGDQYNCLKCGKGFKIKKCCEKHVRNCTYSGNAKKRKRKTFYRDYTSPTFLSTQEETGKSKNQSQVFQFDESYGLCKMEMLEEGIEDGIENEVEEQTLVLTNDGENSVLQVVKGENDFTGIKSEILETEFDEI